MVNTHENIVEYGEDGTAEIEAEIGDGIHHGLAGRAHPPQNGGGAGDAGDGQHRTGAKTECNGSVDGLADGFVILCSVVAGDDDACAHGQTIEEADHQENQRAGTGNRAHGVVVDEESNAPCIKGVV